MNNIDIAREKILNDMQREVRNIIYEDDIKSAQERDEVIAYFKEAMKLEKKWGIYDDTDEYEHNFNMENLRINPEYKSQRMVEVNRKRRLSNGIGMKAMKDYFELLNSINYKTINFEIDDYDANNTNYPGTIVTIKIPEDFSYEL